MKRAAILAALLALSCASAGEPGGDVAVGVHAIAPDGREGAVACIVLPVLGGGRVLSRVIVDDVLAVDADASREDVLLRFLRLLGGEELAPPVQLTRALLASGVEEEVRVTPEPNGSYTILLSSECFE